MFERIRRFGAAPVFYLAAAVMLFWNLGVNHLWGSEDRWAEIARSMVFSGDWLHPAINGTVYFDKPLLTYWPIAALSALTGVMNEFVVRFPCVLAAFLALWATRDLARRTTNHERIADFAGWLLLSGYGFFFWARIAAAEMLNLAVVVLAVDWFFRRRNQAGFWSYLVFYLICFAGALAKGLPALILPPAVVAAWVLADGSWKKHLVWQNFLALPFGIAVGLLPFYLAAVLPMPEYYLQPEHGLSGLQLVWRENVLRVFQPFDHNDEPWCAYFWHVPRIMVPWVLALAGALAAAVAGWKKLSRERRWLWMGAGVIFVLFSLSGSRRWYYILPIMPFLAILIAAWLVNGERWSEWVRKIYWWGFYIAGWVGLFGGIAMLMVLRETGLLGPLLAVAGPAMMILTLAGAAAAVIVLHKCRNWAGVVAAGVIGITVAFSVIYPAVGRLRTEKPFALELGGKLREVPAEQIFFFDREAPKVTFYLGTERPVRLLKNTAALKEILPVYAGKNIYIIAESRPKTLENLFSVLPALETAVPLVEEKRILHVEKPTARKLRCWLYAVPLAR